MKKNFLLLAISAVATLGLLNSCAGEFSTEDALASIADEPEFETAFCAPLNIGKEVLTGENFKDPKGFVERKYGELMHSGLVEAKIGEANSWRILLEVVLTEEGKKLMNEQRTDKYRKESGKDDVCFVAVCNLVPEGPTEVKELEDNIVKLSYRIVERDVTPFGKFLGHENGQIHHHSRKFEKGTFSWELIPLSKKQRD